MQCDLCGKEVKNLGVHKYHKHRDTLKPGEVIAVEHLSELDEKIVVDEITEKPLSELLSNLKGILKTFRHELDVRISESGGRTSEVEIRVRIQV